MSSTTDTSSSASTLPESPSAAKRALMIESSSIQPITRHQKYFDSKVKQISLNFEWRIENFSYYYLDENNLDQCPVICSPKFASPSNEKLKFCLELCPKGEDGDDNGNICLYLRLCNCDRKEIILNYSFWILTANGEYEESVSVEKEIFSENECFGTGELCSREDIQNHSSEYMPGDVLNILCIINYEDIVDEDSVNQNKIVLRELEKDFVRFRQNEESCDVVLGFGDGELKKEFRAHKAILGARSEVFAAMFGHDMREKNDNRVLMTDVDAEMGEVILNYLYGARDEPNFSVYAVKLLPIADKYQLHSLKSICEGQLCFQINYESIGNLLLLADMHNAALLKSKCIEYIHCHSSCVVESENMIDLMHTRPELYYELFNHVPQSPFHSWSLPVLTVDPFKVIWSYTASKVVKCLKRFAFENFNANHLAVNEGGHYLIESTPFPPSKPNNDTSVQFSVKLYPHGENNECKDYLSLYLQLKCEEEMQVAVKVRVSIVVNGNSAKGYTLDIGKKLINGESIGWPKFISKEQLLENKDLLLNSTDGQLVLLCEVSYIENIDKPVTKSDLNTFEDEHKFSIVRDLSSLYKSQKLTDVVFSLGRKKFDVHKSIVSARSSVFARLFANTNRVQIKDVKDVDAFEQMLALVYGQTEGLTQWAHKILPLLDKFGLNSLKDVCQLALCDQLTDENVAELVMLADKHNATLLKAKAIEFIRSKHSVLTKNHSLKVVQQENSKLFYEILCYKLENWNNLADK